MTDPDDCKLDQYLKGDSKLSRLHKEASREQPAPELDDAFFAAPKHEVRAKPGLSKLLAPVALAASLILGVNLAWNVHNAVPVSAVDTAQAPPSLAESQKIAQLIAYVGALRGATFIRNGAEQAPAEAAAQLRLLREKAGDRVKTAEDFIKYCASYSTLTGEAYLVRFPDGRTRTAEDVLREELAKTGVRPLQGSDP